MLSLEKIGGIELSKVAEELQINVQDILKLISKGHLEEISFGGGSIAGVTTSSLDAYRNSKKERKNILDVTLQAIQDAWNIYLENYCARDGKARFVDLYENYATFTKREGFPSLGKVQFGLFLINAEGLQQEFESGMRFIVGIRMINEITTEQDMFYEKTISVVMNNGGSVSGSFKDIAALVDSTPRSLRSKLLNNMHKFTRDGFHVRFDNTRTQNSKASVTIEKAA